MLSGTRGLLVAGGSLRSKAQYSPDKPCILAWFCSPPHPHPTLASWAGLPCLSPGMGFLSLFSNGSAKEGSRAFDFVAAVMIAQ